MNYLRLLQLRRMAADGTGGGGSGAGAGAAGSADGDKGKDGDGAAAAGEGDKAGDDKPKTFTQAELDAIIDKRYAKWKKDTEKAISDARTEAEKMAAMSAEQRAEAEREKRQQELASRETELTRRELRAQALESLAEKGLPKSLADTLNFTDADSCTASIKAVEKAFRAAVEAAVNDRLRGNPPKAGDQKPDYEKMTDAEYYATTMKKG